MRRLWGLAWIAAGFFVLIMALPVGSQFLTAVERRIAVDTLVLDPGHGGIDGGAVGSSGVSEKDINLAIASTIAELAEQDGWTVILTRDRDKGLYTDVIHDGTDQMEIKNHRSIRSLKTEDLKNRKEMIDRIEPTLAVSIHLNSFREDRSVHGAQSFFPEGNFDPRVKEDSKRLAETIQKYIVKGLDDGTDRAVLGKKDMILFKNPTVPIALVECGFLSNAREEELLQQETYQKKLAKFIYEGILEYSGKKPENKPKKQENDTGGLRGIVDSGKTKEQ